MVRRNPHRLVVGLSGSYGSGKSTVGRLFKRFGARKVIDSDRLVHEVFEPGHELGRQVKSLFQVSRINRGRIAEAVFSDPKKRKRLEAILHPYVFRRIDEELKGVREGIIIVEVPLLFEIGFDRRCDFTISVLAGKKNILKRLTKRGIRPEQVRARLQAQLSEREKKSRADLYVLNRGSRRQLLKQAQLVWRKLDSMLKGKSRGA